ncbi:MAG TPA: CidA/LrgA family protein [Telluria sp.]
MLFAFATLLLFQCLGEGLVFVFHLPLPGPVAGMLLLFAALLAFPRLLARLEDTANALLSHLSLLFVPAGAGIVVAASGVRGQWLALAGSVLVSTVLTLLVTAAVMRLCLRGEKGDD